MSIHMRWLAVAALVATVGCQQTKSSSTTESSTSSSATATSTPSTSAPTTSAGGEVTMPNGLKYTDLVVGTGATAEMGSKVSVHYTGWLTDGTKFDSSVDRGQPLPFMIGDTGPRGVIKGWNEGVTGMKVGGKRKLTIPPDMAYGPTGYPPVIPPNATLVFDVELLAINP